MFKKPTSELLLVVVAVAPGCDRGVPDADEQVRAGVGGRRHGGEALRQVQAPGELVGKPKQFRFGFGRKFWPKYVLVLVFRLSSFSAFGRNTFFGKTASFS